MRRKNQVVVLETLGELRELEREAVDPERRRRITALRVLREDPYATMHTIAIAADRPERTVRHWLRVYQQEGLVVFLTGQVPTRSTRRISEDGDAAAQRNLSSPDVT